MIKSIIKILAPIILIIIIIIIGFNTYQDTLEKTDNPLSIIPSNSSVILQFNNASKLNFLLRNTTIWKKLLNINHLRITDNNLNKISTFLKENQNIFNNNPLFVSFHKISANSSNILFSSNFSIKKSSTKKELISLFGNTLKEHNYDNKIIYQIDKNGKNIFCSFKGNIFFFSTSKILVENVIKESTSDENLLTNPNFNLIYKTISKSVDINLFLNYNALTKLASIYTKNNINIDDFSEWISTDIRIKDNVIIANGFGKLDNPLKNYTDIFLDQSIRSTNIINIIPENTSMLLAIGFDNTKLLFDKKNKLLENQNNFWSWDKRRRQLLDSTKVDYNSLIKQLENEAGRFNTFSTKSNNRQYSYFKSENSLTTLSLIQGLIDNRNDYLGYTISECKDPYITSNLFGSLFSCNTPYFTIIDDYFIFGESELSIQNLIDNYIINHTLSNNKNFKNYSSYISTKSNLLFYINPGKTLQNLKGKLNNNYRKNFTFNNDSILNFTGFSIQLSAKKNLLLNNLSLYYDPNFKEDIKEEWIVQLDTAVAISPQFVKNHFTQQKMIVVQTKSNRLYALNSDGEVIWKKMIDSRIIGDINSIDVYKNNKYQALFNTKSHLYLIDRNGKDVEGFPKKLPFHTSLGHSLFDYNKTKRYRIIIIGDDNMIYNLDAKGKKVKGWKYINQEDKIIGSAQHFKVNNNDYILKETGNSNSKLLAINGSERVSYNLEATFNKHPLKIDNNGTLYGITIDGKLWRGNINGNATESSISEVTNQSFFTIDNTTSEEKEQYILTNENSFFIKDKEFEILNSFHFNERIEEIYTFNEYIIVATLTQLYLYNDAKIVEGFPIKTDGLFNISDIQNNGKINIINSRDGTLYNFELAN